MAGDWTGRAMDNLLNPITEVFDSLSRVKKNTFKWMDKAFGEKGQKRMKKVGRATLDAMGIFLQLADAIGVLQPVIQLMTGFLQIMGGAALEALAPALEYVAEKFKDPEFISALQTIGTIIGQLLGGALIIFIEVLGILAKAFEPLLQILGPILIPVIRILAKVIALGLLIPIYTLTIAIFALAKVIAFLIDVVTWGAAGAGSWVDQHIGGFATGLVYGIGEVLRLASGGYVPPSGGGTPAIIGEGGEGEFVIPESKMGSIGQSKEVLWATEDNGMKLDQIYSALISKRRLL